MSSLPPPAPSAAPLSPGAPLPPPRRAAAGPAAPAAPPARQSWFVGRLRALISPKTWKTTAHLLADLPFGIAWFTILVTGLSLGFGTIITFIGIPVLIGVLLFSRVISAVERARARALLDTPIASPFRSLREGSLWSRFKHLIGDGASWKGIAYGLIMLPIGIFNFTVTVIMWAFAVGGVTYPTWHWALPHDEGDYELWFQYPLTTFEHFVAICVYVCGGLIFLVVTPYVVRGLGAVDRGLIRGLLGRSETAELEQRVTQLAESREASVDAAEAERRRIERDLHDGAQQRLVALAMDLGLARQRLEREGDPRTADLVGQAHDEAKRAITELRELVRGIHPAVLTDRGLDAALSAVAARCPVPVDLQISLDARPPAPTEAGAYFVVTESLTNVTKHSRAHVARVRVFRRDAWLVVEVSDDGVGGAAIERAGGLAGLRDRVRALEGVLRLASPVGGPTVLLAELPWPPGT
jgi:signal transduction histidine kinase